MITENLIAVECKGKNGLLFAKAAMHFLELLKVTEHGIPVEIYIEFVSIDVNGYCDFNQDHKYPELTISVNKSISNVDEILLIIAHECVHVKQFLSKELRFKGNKGYWKKAFYDLNGEVDNNTPWEIEAYAKEGHLFSSYSDSRRVKLF